MRSRPRADGPRSGSADSSRHARTAAARDWQIRMKHANRARQVDPQQTPAARWAQIAQSASRCGRQFRRAIAECVARRDLSDTDFFVLACCSRAGASGASQTDLAGSIGVSAAQISGVVDRLRGRGLLAAQRNDTDRRRQHWRLTESGQRLLARALDDLSVLIRRLDQQLPAADRKTAEHVLARLSAAVDDDSRLSLFDPDGNRPRPVDAQEGTPS